MSSASTARAQGSRTTPAKSARPAVPPRVEIDAFHCVRSGRFGGPVLAFADVTLGGQLSIRDVRLVADGDRLHVQPPTKIWSDSSGVSRWKPLVAWPDLWGQAIEAAVLAKWAAVQGGAR